MLKKLFAVIVILILMITIFSLDGAGELWTGKDEMIGYNNVYNFIDMPNANETILAFDNTTENYSFEFKNNVGDINNVQNGRSNRDVVSLELGNGFYIPSDNFNIVNDMGLDWFFNNSIERGLFSDNPFNDEIYFERTFILKSFYFTNDNFYNAQSVYGNAFKNTTHYTGMYWNINPDTYYNFGWYNYAETSDDVMLDHDYGGYLDFWISDDDVVGDYRTFSFNYTFKYFENNTYYPLLLINDEIIDYEEDENPIYISSDGILDITYYGYYHEDDIITQSEYTIETHILSANPSPVGWSSTDGYPNTTSILPSGTYQLEIQYQNELTNIQERVNVKVIVEQPDYFPEGISIKLEGYAIYIFLMLMGGVVILLFLNVIKK